MDHRRVLLVFLFVTVVCSQTSTNPNGAPFFSPSLVRQLPLDTPISSVILASPLDYADFYWGYIPQNVGALTLTLNVTNSCGNSIEALINFVTPRQDLSSSFPCTDSNYYMCYSQDYSLMAYSDSVQATYSYDVPQFRPGKNFYLTLYQYNTPTDNCSYTIQVQTNYNCSNSTALLVWGESDYCVSYSTVTASGQSFSGIASSTPESTNIYRIDVPKNVSFAYAFVTSQDPSLYVLVSAGFASYTSYSADYYTNSGVQLTSNSSLYRYYVQYESPDGDYPLFFSVRSTTDGNPFNISLSWEFCGPTKAGYGDFNADYENAVISYNDPACGSKVQFTNLNLASGQNYTFNVPAYNISSDSNGASYAFLSVPFGTYGAINISCYNDIAYQAYIAFSKNQNTDCGNSYLDFFYCNGDVVELLSEDLYPGGYWTFGACNKGNATNVVMMIGGSVTAPSPLPSASTSPGSTTGQDSSTGSFMAPAVILILIVLSALVQY